ncbi:MAG: beta-galactosidase, partial [Anaerolineae bacterium]
MTDSTMTRSRRAGRLFTLCVIGLVIASLAMALVQGARRQATRGMGPSLPGPIENAGVSPMCVNVALQIYPKSDDLRQTLDRIANAGFVWLRQTFPWAAIEPEPGAFDWEPWDALVDAVSNHPANFRLIVVLDTTPAWASGNARSKSSVAPPTDPAQLVRFARTLAARYGDRVDAYQVWDEPNLNSHWGGRDVDPAGYATLLQAAAEAIRAADDEATIILAGLAPTVETGPRNLSDIRYLEALYDLGAAPYFDVVAGKPYGIDDDEHISERLLNFSRLILLRETMLVHDDGDKALWASHWGWNALPPGWTGPPSPWGQTDPDTQATRTVEALARARREWPWAGALCLENWQPDAPADDPHWGFALIAPDNTPRPAYQALKATTHLPPTNSPGYYHASDGVADYRGDWRFSELGADVTEAGGQQVTIPFEGTDFGLRVRRGDYRAHFYITIDGQPANALPRDENGAYLVLTSPDHQPQVSTLPVARGLDDGPHVAEIVVQRGWGQWPLVGWSVGWWPHAEAKRYQQILTGLGLVALACGAGMAWSARRVQWRWAGQTLRATWKGLSDAAQVAITASVTLVFWANAWLSWGQEHAAGKGGLVATLAAATLFYVSPAFLLSLFSLGLLALLIVLRLDLGLALVAFAAPFYLQSRAMFDQALSVVEIAVLLCLVSWGIQVATATLAARRSESGAKAKEHHAPRNAQRAQRASLDRAVLFFVTVSFISPFVAALRGVALREFRIVVLEPTLFYLMLRTTP